MLVLTLWTSGRTMEKLTSLAVNCSQVKEESIVSYGSQHNEAQ